MAYLEIEALPDIALRLRVSNGGPDLVLQTCGCYREEREGSLPAFCSRHWKPYSLRALSRAELVRDAIYIEPA